MKGIKIIGLPRRFELSPEEVSIKDNAHPGKMGVVVIRIKVRRTSKKIIPLRQKPLPVLEQRKNQYRWLERFFALAGYF